MLKGKAKFWSNRSKPTQGSPKCPTHYAKIPNETSKTKKLSKVKPLGTQPTKWGIPGKREGFPPDGGFTSKALEKRASENSLAAAALLLPEIRKAYDPEELKEVCFMDVDEFGKEDVVFTDNNSLVLGVAHRDTVCDRNHFYRNDLGPAGVHVWNPKLDDRIGVYTITRLLPKMGILIDTLLTTDEECGQSTAEEFSTEKKYNWMVEFDRMGKDAVRYNYTDTDWRTEWEAVGFKVSSGSYSDISELEALGCCGINIGVGYQDNHSEKAVMSEWEYLIGVARFLKFYAKWKNRHFEHTEVVSKYSGSEFGHYDHMGFTPWQCEDMDTSKKQGKHNHKVNEVINFPEDYDCPNCDQSSEWDDLVEDVYGPGLYCPYCLTDMTNEATAPAWHDRAKELAQGVVSDGYDKHSIQCWDCRKILLRKEVLVEADGIANCPECDAYISEWSSAPF